MSKRFTVHLNADQFDRLARPTQPVTAVVELVWNALDAEADEVEVIINRTPMDALESVVVRDDGHGMTAFDVDRDFVQLGGSWKKGASRSRTGRRQMHGRKGEGRFRAFALGEVVEWNTTAEGLSGGLERVEVVGSMITGDFQVDDPKTVPRKTGTTVRITRPREHANRLLSDNARPQLVLAFAPFLLRFPDVTIVHDGQRLDPATLISSTIDIPLDEELGGSHGRPVLQIIEWNERGSSIAASMLLCSSDGTVLHETRERLPGLKDFAYTAYVKWPGFQDYASVLDFADSGHEILGPVVEAGRAAIRQYLDQISAARRTRIVDRWKEERIYPFERPPETSAEHRTQRLFDLVAVTAAPAVSEVRTEAKLTLRLLREALEDSPGALHRVLQEVLDLTPAQIEDFDRLLDQTSLGDIVRTTKLVTDRLAFLKDLERMLYDRDQRKQLLERSQLHKILAPRGWIFGEQYGVVVSDKGLTKVLQSHRQLLGSESESITPVAGDGGNPLIIDLFLSTVAETQDGRRHLVVQLKRPSLTLTLRELNQIDNYALTIIGEPQFAAEGVHWDFWLLGDDMDDKLRTKARQRNRLEGVVTEGDTYRVWA